ncbi:MAG TPA: hypothetical protein VK176_07540 [Phycisphaerales bacterium]|nr:hypothetical protein [Phycisphaerales bacterium]
MNGPGASVHTVRKPVHTDFNAVISVAGLPDPVAGVVRETIVRARLWRAERADVARELCAHFADGLSAGATAEELIADFGDVRRASSLIRAAKRRGRPVWYRAWRLALRAAATTVALTIAAYLFFAARVLVSSPNIAHNYSEELNARTRGIPESERAWPLYLEVIRRTGARPSFMERGQAAFALTDPYWDEQAAWLKSHADVLELIREAAARPVIGYMLANDIDPGLDAAMRDAGRISGPKVSTPRVENPFMIGVLLPHLGELRSHARLLAGDCTLALREKDGSRYRSNIRAILGMARQCLGEPFIISQLVGVAITHVALERVLDARLGPEVFGEADLRDLSHEIGGFAGGRMRIDFEGERYGVLDILQRYYSDDGAGDGYFIGGEQIDALYDDFGMARPRGLPLLRAYVPVQSAIAPSRRQVQNLLDRFIETAQRDEALPPWKHHERISPLWWDRLMESGVYTLFPPLRSFLGSDKAPSVAAVAARDMVETYRAAALVKLAAELHLRRHGTWPSALDQLIPSLLPSAPLDPMTGEPMHYVLSSAGVPVLYSVGVDGVDNGGAATGEAQGRQEVRNFNWIAYFRRERGLPAGALDAQGALAPLTGADAGRFSAARGDWILWKPE